MGSMPKTKEEEVCKPCYGMGVQTLRSGLKIECPSCGGTGIKRPSPTKSRSWK